MDKHLYDNPNARPPNSAGRGAVNGLLLGIGMWLVIGALAYGIYLGVTR